MASLVANAGGGGGLVVAVAVVAVVGTLTSCAEVGSECAGALLQVTAQVCVDVLCDDKNADADADADSDSDESDFDRAAKARAARQREQPAPDWQPREGSCDVVTEGGDAGSVRISCPDGTRATFVGREDPRAIVEADGADADECRGARVLRQGIDVDGDGALSPSEVTGRTVDCPDEDGVRAPTLVGHLAISTPDDVMRLSGRRALTGGLVVKSAGLVRLELPQLQSVGGTLRVDGAPALESLVLAHLATVGGDVVVSRAPKLASVALPMITRVGGSIVVVENPKLPDADVQGIIVRLSRHGFAGPVDLAGNGGVAGVGDAPPAP